MSRTLAKQMPSGTVLSVGHLRFGSAQSPTYNCSYVCKMEENRLTMSFGCVYVHTAQTNKKCG